LLALENASPPPEELESPMLKVDSVSIDAILTVTFNQDMIYPSNINDFDYSKLISFKLISANDGRMTKAESSRPKVRRVLESYDPCAGKILS
jgi:hypothetical protein